MAEMEETRKRIGFHTTMDNGIASVQNRINGITKVLNPAISSFFQLPQKLQNGLKFQLNRLAKDNEKIMSNVNSFLGNNRGSSATVGIDLEKQMEAWRANSSWVEQPSEIKVSVLKASLCKFSVDFVLGLPPDAVFDIIIDPDNKRVFKNIKEVISRKVVVDEGQRQVVELEQAATWKFLWWSGVLSVHLLVDQNREDYTMKFKQLKTGFMKRFEGSWKLEPIFVDEKVGFPLKPKSWADYNSSTGGNGRIGSRVSLEQLVQPAVVAPPPISWYVRGITAKAVEMLIADLIAEATRIRGDFSTAENSDKNLKPSTGTNEETELDQVRDIKERWSIRRRYAKQCHRQLLAAESRNSG